MKIDISLEGFNVHRLKLLVLDSLCNSPTGWLDGIRRSATTEKWSEIKAEVDTERTLYPTNKRMTVKVGRKVNIMMEIERLDC